MEAAATEELVAMASPYPDFDIGAVRDLLSRGADPNAVDSSNVSVFAIACRYGHVDVIQALLDAGADIDSGHSRISPLSWLADQVGPYGARMETNGKIKFLLDAGAKMNGAHGTENLLTMAASVGYQEIVDLALEYGADPHEKDRLGRSYHDVWLQPSSSPN